jgi:ABC-type microcin C transport system duplicated ATPase subunit YejF
MSTKNNNHSGYIIFNIQNVDNYSTVHTEPVLRIRTQIRIIYQDPDPPPGV